MDVCATHTCSSYRYQKKVPDALELALQMVMRHNGCWELNLGLLQE